MDSTWEPGAGAQEPPGVRGVEWPEGCPRNWRDPSRRRHQRSRAATPWCPAAAKPISSDPAKWRSVERKSEGAVVATTDGTTQPAPSEGPLARCVEQAVTTVGLPWWLLTHPPMADQVHEPQGEAWILGQRRGAAECRRSTAWGKAVCGRTACTVWEGAAGEARPGPAEVGEEAHCPAPGWPINGRPASGLPHRSTSPSQPPPDISVEPLGFQAPPRGVKRQS